MKKSKSVTKTNKLKRIQSATKSKVPRARSRKATTGQRSRLNIKLLNPIIITLAIAGVAFAITQAEKLNFASAASRPNVVVVFADDMRQDDLAYMPNVKRLIGDEGTTYSNAFSENPLCCPARAVLLTGQYSHNNKVLGNKASQMGGFARFNDKRTIPVALKKGGYNTAYYGKYMNQYPGKNKRYVPPGWTKWRVPVGSTYNYSTALMNENGKLRRYNKYRTDMTKWQSSAMLKNLASKKKPFVAYISHLAPHTGFNGKHWHNPTPAKRHKGSENGVSLPASEAMNEADVSDKPWVIRRISKRSSQSMDNIRKLHQARIESLKAVDQAVAHNISTLKKSGELKNTIFMFTSDNGFMLGEHRIAQDKRVGYEESIRVPLLVRGPGFKKGAVDDNFVGLVDVATTVVFAAKSKRHLPYIPDGRSLQWNMRKKPVLLETGPQILGKFAIKERKRSYTGIRIPGYSYMKYWNGDEELYDLEADPDQTVSQHDNPDYNEQLQTLRSVHNKMKNCKGLNCRYLDY